jgi:hypothetical protein
MSAIEGNPDIHRRGAESDPSRTFLAAHGLLVSVAFYVVRSLRAADQS